MPDFVESILMTFQMSLGEVMDVWNCLERSWHSVIGKLHWFMFVMVSCDWWTAGHVYSFKRRLSEASRRFHNYGECPN